MYRLKRPSQHEMSSYLNTMNDAELSYSHLCATLTNTIPDGWTVNHAKVSLGGGDGVWSVARSALRDFAMFDVDWVDLVPCDAQLEKGKLVATVARIFGIWTFNACRIVDVVDEPDRFGFAYGTLASHAMRGEERFLLLRNPENGEIDFDITSFSKPRDVVSHLTLPLVRKIQRRFVDESCQSFARNVFQRLECHTLKPAV